MGYPFLLRYESVVAMTLVSDLSEVQDNIATHPDLGMDTTAGSLALVGSRPTENAEIVDRVSAVKVLIEFQLIVSLFWQA